VGGRIGRRPEGIHQLEVAEGAASRVVWLPRRAARLALRRRPRRLIPLLVGPMGVRGEPRLDGLDDPDLLAGPADGEPRRTVGRMVHGLAAQRARRDGIAGFRGHPDPRARLLVKEPLERHETEELALAGGALVVDAASGDPAERLGASWAQGRVR
jgi:hypothetical protein